MLYIDGKYLYTDGVPSGSILSRLMQRNDSQIMALEALAIALGLCTFAPELHKRKVVVWSDNKAAEGAARKGSAKCWDHCEIVHEVWAQAWHNKCFLWIKRVGSKFNIADSPSREEYQILRDIGATWRRPVISKLFIEGDMCGAQLRGPPE